MDVGPPLAQSPNVLGAASAISETGDAFVVLLDGAGSGLWVRRYDATAHVFAAPDLIDADGDADDFIGTDAQGDAIVAYVDKARNIHARRWTAAPGGGSWAPSEILATATSRMTANLTGLAVTPSGHAVAVGFDDTDTTGSIVPFLSVFEAGRGWSAGQNPFSSLTPYSILAAVAQVGSTLRIATAATVLDPVRLNNLTAVYGSSFAYDLASHTAASSSPVPLVVPAGMIPAYTGTMAMDTRGNGWLTSTQDQLGAQDTFTTYLSQFSNGAWSTTDAFLLPPGRFPSLAVAPGGDALEAWLQCTDDSFSGKAPCAIRARRYVGGAWQPDVALSAANLSPDNEPVAAIDDEGHAVVLWPDFSPGHLTAFASEFDPATGWSMAHLVVENTDPSVSFGNGLVAGFGDGTAFVTWTASNGAGVQTPQALFCRFR